MTKDVDKYIKQFPEEISSRLNLIRKTIKSITPESVESISYGMPAYKLNKKALVYFSAFPKHIGFYATPNGHVQFKDKLSAYKQGKGSVQFPHDQPLPIDLISEMVQFRVAENNRMNRI